MSLKPNEGIEDVDMSLSHRTVALGCHSGDGRGSGRGPDLSTKVPKLQLPGIVGVIESGATFMPSFKEETTLEERQQIAGWLAATFGATAPAAVSPVDAESVDDGAVNKP
jgi:mono/diheme cytochrome c family protein